MKELRRRVNRDFERFNETFKTAISPLSEKERTVFYDTFYRLPGVTAYLEQKVEEYDEASGEEFDKFIDRNFEEYKAEYEKKNKSKVCR